MNINATLFGQTIAFAVFVWFCMKFVWPPIVTALNERKARITEGLAAAEQGRQEKAAAEQQALKVTDEAKSQAQEILRRAERREAEVIEEAKVAVAEEDDYHIEEKKLSAIFQFAKAMPLLLEGIARYDTHESGGSDNKRKRSEGVARN